MKVTPLASGSSGNATLVETEQGSILIDAGLTAHNLVKHIQSLGVETNTLKGIFLTHEHSDHWKGAPVLAKQLNVPVFATQGTFQVLESKFNNHQLCVIKAHDVLTISGLALRVHQVIHDAHEPVCFSVDESEQKFAVITDIGQVNEEIKELLATLDAVVFEANYDPQMLDQSPYPEQLKRRIRGGRGHLANHLAGEALKNHLNPQCRFVILAHLSENSNTPLKAMTCISHYLKPKIHRGLAVAVATRHEPFGRLDLKSLKTVETVNEYSRKIS